MDNLFPARVVLALSIKSCKYIMQNLKTFNNEHISDKKNDIIN